MPEYKSENIEIAEHSSLKPEIAGRLIGKTIAGIITEEYALKLIFTDGSTFETFGTLTHGGPLGVDFVESEEKNLEPEKAETEWHQVKT